MLRLALSDLRSRKRRLAGVAVAVAVGVAFLSGTLVLGDTLSANFTRLFTDVTAGTDVVVRNAVDVAPGQVIDGRGPVPASLVDVVARVPGVEAVAPQIVGYGSLIGADGKAIGGNGPPRQAGNWIADPALNPYRLAEGRAPERPDEVVVNRGAIKAGKLHLGDTAVVQTPDPVIVTIVGVSTFGGADGFGQTTFTAFTFDGARQHVMHGADAVTAVVARGTGDADALRARVAAALPEGAEAITGQRVAKERIDSVTSQFLGMVKTLLVVFALVALVVAGITIANTFSITVAQRSHELALLRAVGASRSQVRRMASIEALVVSAIGSLAGAVGGLGVAGLLKGLFDAAGGALPAGGLTIRPAALAIGMAAGIVVTALAAQGAARRAGRTSPIAALADAGEQQLASRRLVAGVALLVVGAGVSLAGGAGSSAPLAGLGAAAVFGAALALAPFALRAVASRLGRGSLAAGNIGRQPRRSASTATALVVGVAVVSLFTVLAASLATSVDRDVRGTLRADIAVNTAVFGGSKLSPEVLPALRSAPGVAAAVGLGFGAALLDDESVNLTATDPAHVTDVVAVVTRAGSFADVGSGGIAVSTSLASDRGWAVGSAVTLTTADGARIPLIVRAVYESDRLLGSAVVHEAVWNSHTTQPVLRTALVTKAAGTSDAALRAAVEPIAGRFGGEAQNAAEMASAARGGLDTLLGIIYALLGLAVLVALLGIANALSLAVHERRREIGLLRAVGQTRRQARRTLRLEAVIIAFTATVVGIAVGAFAGGTLFAAVSDSPGFTLPVGRLVVVAVAGAVAGALAGRRPARRAARMPVLEALGTA